ncbi:hypothetical protein JKP88DRAFT_147102, partial [Tribonema minus]
MNPHLVARAQELCVANDREELKALFANYYEHFGAIPLDDSDVTDSQAINDLVRENVILNGVTFFGHSQQFLKALRRVVDVWASSLEYTGALTASEISQRVLRKASRTTSGSDSYFTVQQLFSADENYLLKPRGFALPPIEVDVYLSDGCIHSKVTCTNLYGLYSMDDIDCPTDGVLKPPKPWLSLDTTVVEETNHNTCQNVRHLEIIIPEDAD